MYKYLYLFAGMLLVAVAVFLAYNESSSTIEEIGSGAAGFPVLIGFLVLAVFTFPTGILGIAVGAWLAYEGITTPAETLAVATVISFSIGFWQWFKLFPRVFKGK